MTADAVAGRLRTYRFSLKEAPVAPGHTDQRLFSRPSRYARSNEPANARAGYVRIRRMQVKSAGNHPAIEQLYGQIHILVR